jgi:hypothetical protein
VREGLRGGVVVVVVAVVGARIGARAGAGAALSERLITTYGLKWDMALCVIVIVVLMELWSRGPYKRTAAGTLHS